MTTPRRLVILESPFADPTPEGRAAKRDYLHRCLRDSLARGEAPFASHAIYPLVLNDTIPAERAIGIECGAAWSLMAESFAFYTDLGWSPGMLAALRSYYGREFDGIYCRALDGPAVAPPFALVEDFMTRAELEDFTTWCVEGAADAPETPDDR